MRWGNAAAVVLVCGLGNRSGAADVQINGLDKPVPQYGFAELSVKLEAGDMASWQVYPQPVKKTQPGPGQLYIGAKPGAAFQVNVTVVNFDKKTLETGQGTLTFAGEAPDVDPIPPDGPASDPAVSKLAAKFLAAVELEDDAERVYTKKLAALYRNAVTKVDAAATMQDLYAAMAAEATQTDGVAGHLKVLQVAVSKEMKANVPWKAEEVEKPLTAAQKTKIKATLKRVADALDRVK
jgi:hypothetical protein